MKIRNIVIIAVIVLFIGFLVYNKIRNTNTELQKNKAIAAQKNTSAIVDIAIVNPARLDNRIMSSGTVIANNEVDLFSEISGKITHIYFKEGGRVTKGELLVKIYDEDLQAQLMRAKAAYAIASETEARNKKLLTKQGISEEEYDQSRSALDEAKADVDLLKVQISKTEIRSPYNGVIGLKNVSEGTFIAPSVKIATIQEIEPIKLDFSVPEKYMARVNVGDGVKFTVQGLKDTFTAQIFAIEPKIDLATRSLMVRAVCPNKDETIKPGAFAEVNLVLKESDNAILVPTQSIIPVLKGNKIYLLKNGKAKLIDIKTGLRNDTSIEVTEGLQAGDSIITTGIMMLKPGSAVRIKNIEK